MKSTIRYFPSGGRDNTEETLRAVRDRAPLAREVAARRDVRPASELVEHHGCLLLVAACELHVIEVQVRAHRGHHADEIVGVTLFLASPDRTT